MISKFHSHEEEKWYVNGFLHKANGPAKISTLYNDNSFYLVGLFMSEDYYKLISILYRMNIIYE